MPTKVKVNLSTPTQHAHVVRSMLMQFSSRAASREPSKLTNIFPYSIQALKAITVIGYVSPYMGQCFVTRVANPTPNQSSCFTTRTENMQKR